MPIQITWPMLLIVCPLCFFAGLVDAIAGGGGMISLPAYYFAGLPLHVASGTNKLSASLGALTATWRFFRSGHIVWVSALSAALLALPGAALGTVVLNSMSDQQALRMVVLVLPVVAVIVLMRLGALSPIIKLPKAAMVPVCALIGLVIGFYDGMVGPGTGTFLILLFTLIVGMSPVNASGSAKVVNLASNVASLVTHIASGNVLFGLGLPVAAFAIAGSWVGARMAIRGGEKMVRLMLFIVLLLLFGTMVVKAFFPQALP